MKSLEDKVKSVIKGITPKVNRSKSFKEYTTYNKNYKDMVDRGLATHRGYNIQTISDKPCVASFNSVVNVNF